MSSRKRLLAWLIAIGGIVAAATAAWSLLPGLLESRAERALEALGLRPVAVVISRIGFERAELSSLTIGDGLGLRLEGIELVYSPRALLGGRIDQIRVRHLVAGATLVDGRLSLGALDVLLAPSPEAESEVGPPLLLPSHVRIDRVTLQLHDGAATWQAEGAAEATLDSGGVTSLIASARARGPGGIHANVAARSRPAGSLELEFDSLAPASTWLAGAPRISIESHTTAKAPWLRFWEKRNAGSPIRELEGSSVAQIALGGISWQERTITSQLDLVVRFVDGRFRDRSPHSRCWPRPTRRGQRDIRRPARTRAHRECATRNFAVRMAGS